MKPPYIFRFLPFLAYAALSLAIFPARSSAQFRFLEPAGQYAGQTEATLYSSSPTRMRIDLSGQWNYAVEGGPTGSVNVPSAYDFTGKVAFQRSFRVDNIPASRKDSLRFHLVAYGINYNSEVTINNDFITNHTGGYTSVIQPVPNNTVQFGQDNVVRVTVNNELDQRRTLPLRPRVWEWRNYGGILRDFYLLATPKVFIRETNASVELSEKPAVARIAIRGVVDGIDSVGESYGYYVELFDRLSGESVGKSGMVTIVKERDEAQTIRVSLAVTDPKLWSPDSPELYIMKSYLVRTVGKDWQGKPITRVVDEIDQPFGIRTVELSSGHIAVNGKRIAVKGVIWNEDGPVSGSVVSYEQMEKDVVMIKNLGANTIRFIDHPPHPYMLDLCDRYGLFAFEELPMHGTPAPILADDNYIDLAGGMLKEMIARDQGHPSVISWGLGSDCQVTLAESRTAAEGLARLAHTLDTRPTYYVTGGANMDSCGEALDLPSFTASDRDVKEFRAELEQWRAKHPNRPVLVGQYGTEVDQNNRRGYSDPLSQEAQARYFLQRIDLLRSMDYDGGFVWAFNDWQGDRAALSVSTGNPYVHSVGLVSIDRERRLAYDAVRAAYSGEKFAALPVGSYSVSAPIIYVLAGFIVLVGTAYVYNANRRFRAHMNRSIFSSYNFYADVRDQQSVPYWQTLLLAVVVSLATAIAASSILYHYRDNVIADTILSFLLVSDKLKAPFVHLVRKPVDFIGIFAGGVFVLLLILSLLVYFVRIFFRTRIFLFHALTVTIWSAAPLIILIPVGMVLYRVMESPVYVVPSLIVIGVILLWVFLRLLKGMAIVFDTSQIKLYFTGILVLALVIGGIYLYFDYVTAAPMFISTAVTSMPHIL